MRFYILFTALTWGLSAHAFQVGFNLVDCWVEGYACGGKSCPSQFRNYECGSVASLTNAINELTALGCTGIDLGRGAIGSSASGPRVEPFFSTEEGKGRCVMWGQGCTTGDAIQGTIYPCGDTAQALNAINGLRDNGCTSISPKNPVDLSIKAPTFVTLPSLGSCSKE